MENLKIHSEGKENHLSTIREKYDKLKKLLFANTKLSKEDKQVEAKKLDKQSKKEMKATDRNLYLEN